MLTTAFQTQPTCCQDCHRQRRHPRVGLNMAAWTQVFSLSNQRRCQPCWYPLDLVWRAGLPLANVSVLIGFLATSTQELQLDTTMVCECKFSQFCQLQEYQLSLSLSGYVCIWDLSSSLLSSSHLAAWQRLHPLIQIVGQSEPCRAVAWCPHDSNYLVTGIDSNVSTCTHGSSLHHT